VCTHFNFCAPSNSSIIFFPICTEYRKKSPPTSLRIEEESNPDYETLSPFEIEDGDDERQSVVGTLRRPTLAYIKEYSHQSSSDYESIASLDLGQGRRNADAAAMYANTPGSASYSSSTNCSHDYECIDNLTITATIDMDPDSPPYIPNGATRNKHLKIDSHGYASVEYPREDDGWIDCLNEESDHEKDQDRDLDRYQEKHQESPFSSTNNITVHNVEEAWKHQLIKGYAPLTMQQDPPQFGRTRSAPSPAHAAAKPAEPLDYEVPVHMMMPPPPPPMIELRRISLLKQQQAAGQLSDVQEEDNTRTTGKDEEVEIDVTSVTSSQSQMDESVDALVQTDSDEFKMRHRVMTAPTLSFQTFTTLK
jgi:hypothetical protein